MAQRVQSSREHRKQRWERGMLVRRGDASRSRSLPQVQSSPTSALHLPPAPLSMDFHDFRFSVLLGQRKAPQETGGWEGSEVRDLESPGH